MKRLLLLVGLAVVLFFAAVYIIVPAHTKITRTIEVDNMPGIYRSLTDSSKWRLWWPEQKATDPGLNFRGLRYKFKDYTVSSIFINVEKDNDVIGSAINFIPGLKNTVTLNWEADIPSSFNPFLRIRRYLVARSMSDDFNDLLSRIKSYYSDTENMYGLAIKREIVKNSALVFTYDSSKGFPSTEKIYTMVEELKSYIAQNHSHVTDSPMVNINTTDSIYYLTRVAVPADSVLKSSGKISYKWMLGGGNILTSQVTGGNTAINRAFKTIELYMEDYHLASPAIPFYALSTNRLAERDSSKWISKIYYPVMYYE